MEFKRTNSSMMGSKSGRQAPPRPPTSTSTPMRLATPSRVSTPCRGTTPHSRNSAESTTLTAQKPPRPGGAPTSARGPKPGLPRPEGFRRTGTSASISGVNNVSSISSIGNTTGSGRNSQLPLRTLSGKTGGNGRVNVYARVRAFVPNETAEDQRQLAVRMNDDTVEVTVPQKGHFTFTFDGTFWSNDNPGEKPMSSQEDVFEAIGRPLVENALAGYNAAIMMYGQTGSGKTYTAFGPPNSLGTCHEGLIPRICEMIFSRASASSQKGVSYRVSVSLLEVYLEDVFDLLNQRQMVSIRNNYIDNSFHVVGAKTVPVRSYKDVAVLLKEAEPLRTFAATAIHDRSSRAHTLFRLEVQTSFESADIIPRASKILLADLAGSERIKLAHTETGLPFEQARNINLSLLALGSCIEAVAARKGQNQNIPEFRNSTLTKLLKEYLGGNSVSAMVVTIAPSVRDANLSVQSLRFADRARQIVSHAKINTVKPIDATDEGAEKLSEELRDEYLKKKEALFAEYQLQNTIAHLLNKIAILEAQLMEATDEDLIARLQEEIAGYQKNLADADAQLQEQRRILYPNEILQDEQLKELDTKIQEMKEEHEEAIESLMTEDHRKYTERIRENESQYTEKICAMIMEHNNEVSRLQQLLEEANNKNEQLKKVLEDTKKQLHEADENLDEMQSAFKELEDASSAMENKLQGEVADRDEKLEEMTAAHKDLEERYADDTRAAEEKRADLEGQIKQLQGDVADRDEKLEEMTTAHKDLEERYADDTRAAEEKRADLEGQIKQLQGDVADRDEKLEEMTAAQKDLEVHIEELQGEVADRDEKLEEMTTAHKDLEERYADDTRAAEEKRADLEGQIKQLQGDVADRDEKLEEMTAAQKDLEVHIEELQGEVADRDEKLEEMTTAHKDLEERYADDTRAAEEKRADLEGQIKQLQGDVADRDEKLEEMTAAHKDLEERYADDTRAAEEKRADLEGQIKQLQGDVADRDEKLEEMATAHKDLEERYADDTRAAEEKRADLERQIKQLQGDVADRDEKLEEMTTAHKDLEERYADDTRAAEEKRADLEGQIKQLQGDVADRDEKLEEMTTAHKDLEVHIEELQGEVADRDEKLEEMTTAHKDLEERYADDTRAAEEKRADLERQIKQLQGDVADRDEKLEEMTIAHKDLEVHIEELQGEVADRDEKLEEMTTAQKDLEVHIEELQGEVADRDEKLEEMTAAHKDLEVHIEELQGEVADRDEKLEEMTAAQKNLEVQIEDLQGQIEQLQGEVADRDEKLEEMTTAHKDLEERYADDTRAAEEKRADLECQLKNVESELQAAEQQMQQEIAALESEVDVWRGKLDAEQNQSEEQSLAFEARIKELDGELQEANDRIRWLNNYMVNVDRYCRGAYETTLEGLGVKQQEALEELSVLTTANMTEYADATAARLELMGVVEDLQRKLDETNEEAMKESEKLRKLLNASKVSGRSRLNALLALVQTAQGVLREAADVEMEDEDMDGTLHMGSPEPHLRRSVPLADFSNKENNAKDLKEFH